MPFFCMIGNCALSYKTLREDAHSAQGWMVAEATAPRRENVPRHILFHLFGALFAVSGTNILKKRGLNL